MGITDPYVAYCLDSAVGEFGRALEAELSAVEGKTRKEVERRSTRILRKWLDLPQQFRSPVGPTQSPTPND